MGRSFSLNVKSQENLSNISISRGHNGVVVEGDLGERLSVSLIEGLLLEIRGTNGILRVEVKQVELEQALKALSEDQPGLRGGEH